MLAIGINRESVQIAAMIAVKRCVHLTGLCSMEWISFLCKSRFSVLDLRLFLWKLGVCIDSSLLGIENPSASFF